MSRRIQLLVVIAVAGVLSGCVTREAVDGATGPASRDSAGVRIVENTQAIGDGWRVAPSPLFVVGWTADDPDFTWVQSGRILPDGGALVGEYGSAMLYRLGPDGSVLATWGRKGEGPGEYQGLDAIVVSGDSVFVSDGRLRRLTLLSLSGEVLNTSPLPGAFLHKVSSTLSGGRVLLVPGEGYSSVSEIRPEWVFQTQPILAMSLDEAGTDTLADLPHLRRWFGTRGAGPGSVAVKGRAGGFADGFAWARSDEPEVRWYDGSGRVTQVARWSEAPEALSAEKRSLMTGALREELGRRGADEDRIRAQMAQYEEGLDRFEGPMPFWSSFVVDRQGNAWLSEYPSTPIQTPQRWRIVARDGTYLGWVELPNLVTVLDVTDDRILGVRLDEWEVPAVVMLELSKPQ